ncbi:MAG: hypothetical protein RSA73_03305 [Anaerovoracaceae bacterium]
MKRGIKLISAITLALLLTMPLTSVISNGADLNVKIGGDAKVKAGETFTVTVKYSGRSLGMVNGDLTYDTNAISYISGGSSSGDGGLVQLKKASEGKTVAFKVKFKGVKGGKSTLKLTTNEAYDLDGKSLSTPSSSKSITVAKSSEPVQTTKETVKQTEETTQVATDTVADSSEETTVETEKEKTPPGITKPVMIGGGVLLVVLALIAIFGRKRN